MPDKISPEARSAVMRRVKGRDTSLERKVRSALHRRGLRFRLRYPLPGKPDIVFVRARVVIFIDSCFWHGCPQHLRMPKSNQDYWQRKIQRNIERDDQINTSYRYSDWESLRFWEHELKEDFDACIEKIAKTIHKRTLIFRNVGLHRTLSTNEHKTLTLPARIAELFPHDALYDWSSRAEWGIGEDAFSYIGSTSLSYIQVFCHPKALREHPDLVAYYRNTAVLSQKSVKYLTGIDAKKYEADQPSNIILSSADAQKLARLFNEHITLIIDSSVLTLTSQELEGLLLASTGAQIDGSWRNRIGEEAEKVVQRLIVKEGVQRGVVHAFIKREQSRIVPFTEQTAELILSEISDYRGVMLTNKTSMLFSSEPDIALISQDGSTLAVIEVKGGIDPAGALERYGAAKKSFDKVRVASSDAVTIFIANSITSEVRQRLQSDKNVTKYFDLAKVLNDPETGEQFISYIFGLLIPNNP